MRTVVVYNRRVKRILSGTDHGIELVRGEISDGVANNELRPGENVAVRLPRRFAMRWFQLVPREQVRAFPGQSNYGIDFDYSMS